MLYQEEILSDEKYEENSEDDSDKSEDTDTEVDLSRKRKHDEPENGKKKKCRKDNKQLTADELNELKITETQYSSSLMRLQIEELLSNVSVSKKHLDKAEKFLESVQNIISNTNVNVKKQMTKIKFKGKNDIKCKEFKTDKDLEIRFEKPEKTRLFGSYVLKTTVKNDGINININVTIPSNCFQERDYLNNRYIVKRNYYLMYLCNHLKQAFKDATITIQYYNNIKYFPFIHIIPNMEKKMNICVYATADENTFKLFRCFPDKNNIKFDFDSDFSDVNVKEFENVGTPLYNSILARDWTLNINNEWLETTLNSKNIQDGIRLIYVWLYLRDLNRSVNGFSFEILCYVIGYLIHKKRINEFMSSYQIARIFWHFLANTNWTEEPICIADDIKENVLKMYKENFDVVFLDKSGFYNVTSFLDVEIYLNLRNEAKRSFNILDNDHFNSFTYLFNTKIPFALQFDALIKIHNKYNIENVYSKASDEEKWKYYGFHDILILKKLRDILKQGLNNRVNCMVPKFQTKQDDSDGIFLIGLTLNTSSAFSVIERGPSSEKTAEIEEFKKFWGPYSDFRRFQDSTAAQVAVFPSKTIKERRNIFARIVKYVLEEKNGLSVEIVANQLEEVVTDKIREPSFPVGTNEEACLKVKRAHDDLTKIIRELKVELPVNSVQGTSSVFCYTELFPPVPTTYRCGKKITTASGSKILFKNDAALKSFPRYVYPIESVMQLGRSSAWPNDLDAVRAIKCEFYLKIANVLKEQFGIISDVKYDYFDVLYEGLIFRFRLFVPKELTLLKKSVSDDGVIVFKSNEESLKLERELEITPKIISALNGIQQCQPSFGSSCTLIKRWLRTHMIDDYHISDMVIDLWNASLYVNDSPYETANLPQVGFLRFLKHVANFDFNTDYVIVNFNNDIEKQKLEESERTFINNRQALPHLYIMTPYDNGDSIFTKRHPTLNIMKRIQVLAGATYEYLSELAIDWQPFNIKEIFQPNLDGFDVVIHLNNYLNPCNYERITFEEVEKRIKIEDYNKKVSTLIPIVDFNPVQIFLHEIRKIYGKFAIFFHDTYGGNTIGMLWNVNELEPKDFKITNINGRRLIGDKLHLDTESILEDIFNRGAGIVKNIEKV